MLGHREYLALRRFPAIDGLRAVSILLVITWHVNSTLWRRVEGWEGVTIFFVISGFLITTLLLREQAANGRVSLIAFYRRRAARILPVYLVVLGFYVALVIGLDWHHHRGLLGDVLPYYLTFTNDFAPLVRDTPFAQTWSLGVEEKFYLVWPLLAFVLVAVRGRVVAAAALSIAPFLLLPFGVLGWFYAYAAIMVGCLLALALHDAKSYRVVVRLARPAGAVAAVAALVGLQLLLPSGRPVEYAYPFAVAAVMVGLATGGGPLVWLLSTRPARLLGRLSYSVYLVHMIVASAVVAVAGKTGLAIGETGIPDGWLGSIVVLAAVTAGSFLFASVLYARVERPWIARGRRAREPAAVTTTAALQPTTP